MARSRSSQSGSGVAGRLALILAALVLLVLVGGAAYLATRSIPAPEQGVEKVIPDDRFPR